jgi:hypothetical protein
MAMTLKKPIVGNKILLWSANWTPNGRSQNGDIGVAADCREDGDRPGEGLSDGEIDWAENKDTGNVDLGKDRLGGRLGRIEMSAAANVDHWEAALGSDVNKGSAEWA